MQSDLTRRHKLKSASRDAKKVGRLPDISLKEQADRIRNRPIIVRKRRIPWITLITIASIIPFIWGDNMKIIDMAGVTEIQKAKMIDALDTVDIDADNPMKLSVDVGDKRIIPKK